MCTRRDIIIYIDLVLTFWTRFLFKFVEALDVDDDSDVNDVKRYGLKWLFAQNVRPYRSMFEMWLPLYCASLESTKARLLRL